MKTFDSWAWVEYFRGSRVGGSVKGILESAEVLFTPALCLTELKARYVREGHDPTTRLRFVKSRTSIIDVDASIAERAADVKLEHRLHTVDAVILSCALSHRAELVTGDEHFRNIPGAMMLEP
jgi:predicted nucleic acid-binding protein